MDGRKIPFFNEKGISPKKSLTFFFYICMMKEKQKILLLLRHLLFVLLILLLFLRLLCFCVLSHFSSIIFLRWSFCVRPHLKPQNQFIHSLNIFYYSYYSFYSNSHSIHDVMPSSRQSPEYNKTYDSLII